MRIVAGKFRGHELVRPADKAIRPTADRIRESLFNILLHNPALHGPRGPLPMAAHVLDLCAGTGALGLEALSRGADRVCFIDQAPAAVRILRENIRALDVGDQATALCCDVTMPGRAAHAFDLVLIDPPYDQDIISPALQSGRDGGWFAPGALIVAERGSTSILRLPDWVTLLEERKYGRTILSFARV